MNYNYPYDMFNQDYLNAYAKQRREDAERQHKEQQDNIRDLAKAAHDFIEAAQKVRPEYQQQAQNAVFDVIFACMMQSQFGGSYSDYTGNRF